MIVCPYTCIYTYTCIYRTIYVMCMHVHIYMSTYIHKCITTNSHISIHVCLPIYMYTYTSMYTYIYVMCMHVHLYMSAYIMHIYRNTYTHICISLYTYRPYLNVNIHIAHIYTHVMHPYICCV